MKRIVASGNMVEVPIKRSTDSGSFWYQYDDLADDDLRTALRELEDKLDRASRYYDDLYLEGEEARTEGRNPYKGYAEQRAAAQARCRQLVEQWRALAEAILERCDA